MLIGNRSTDDEPHPEVDDDRPSASTSIVGHVGTFGSHREYLNKTKQEDRSRNAHPMKITSAAHLTLFQSVSHEETGDDCYSCEPAAVMLVNVFIYLYL